MVQRNLDDHKKANSDFAVGHSLFPEPPFPLSSVDPRNLPTPHGPDQRYLSRIAQWTWWLRLFMNLRTRPWPTTYCQLRTEQNTRSQGFCFAKNICQLNYHPDRYKFQSSIGAYEDKTATLSDSDSVWTEVRHMHMREAIDKLMADFNKFLGDNAGFKGQVVY
jgi:hypothetical protein